MSDNTSLVPVNLEQLPSTQIGSDEVFADLAKSADYIGRLQLFTKGKAINKKLVGPGNYGIPESDEEVIDLGDTIDIIPLARRPKAIDMTDSEAIIVNYDPEANEFKRIAAQSLEKESHCMYGPSFLVYERSTGRFLEFFCGNKSSRSEAKKVYPYLPLSQADIDAKASFWQRARYLPPIKIAAPASQPSDSPADIAPMLDAFRLAYTNLQEIWSLVLPPNTLLGLKRLSLTDAAAFRMPESLWARIVYDFLLAYRLRTINRGHLLGALIPLYLAWVAGHLNITAAGTDPELHVEMVAAAFEVDKAYLVSRWRWPDRFNP